MLTNKICARPFFNSNYFHISLPIPICRPWTSLGNTVFTQIVSSYNYERLIRSISTPNKYALFLLIFLLLFLRPSFLRLFYLLPLFVLPLSTPLYLYALFVLIFVLLYSYSLSSYSLLLSPSICIHNIYAFFSKNFSQKNKYA